MMNTLLPDPEPGYRYQLSSESFDFNIITNSQQFMKYKKHAETQGLVRDICDPALNDVQDVPTEDFLHIEQKSKTWFRFRSAADGTASSVGKKIKGPTMYPTMEQVTEEWHNILTSKPFEITHTMAGHMKWGVGYEDPALVHFAVDNMLSVVQVGTIYLPLSYILQMVSEYTPELESHVKYLHETIPSTAHLLVSPDGLVGYPDDGSYNDIPQELIGMLEIKCISPFHHVVDENTSALTWVDDMETRQWYHAGEIPFVYVTQICLQAISGLYRLNMSADDTMWFIRWSPVGFSEFTIKFGPLIHMGIIASMLYFRLKSRLDLDSLPIVYTKEENELSTALYKSYQVILRMMSHRYVSHRGLYPEFHTYRKCTQFHHFVVKHE
jgi:hypothetical protein